MTTEELKELELDIFSECYQYFVSIVEEKLEDRGISGVKVKDIDIFLE